MGKIPKNGLVSIYADKDLKTALKNIKCPLHHCLKPHLKPEEAFILEPNPMAKGFSDDLCKKFNLRKWQYKKDKFGRRIPNFRNHYQPEVSALYLQEKVYTPNHPTCRMCRKCIL